MCFHLCVMMTFTGKTKKHVVHVHRRDRHVNIINVVFHVPIMEVNKSLEEVVEGFHPRPWLEMCLYIVTVHGYLTLVIVFTHPLQEGKSEFITLFPRGERCRHVNLVLFQ